VSRVKAFGSLLLNFLRKPVTVKESFGFLADTFRWLPRRDDNKCTGCGACSERCSTGATTVSDALLDRKVSIDSWMCIFCGRCAEICPEKALELTFEPNDGGKHAAQYVDGDPDLEYTKKISLAHNSDEPKKTVDTVLRLQRCSICGDAMPVTEKYLSVIKERTLNNLQPETAAITGNDMNKYLTACISCRRKYSLDWDTHPRKFI
jgi:formate hydrogenlyase subunit 6/NADH:ubiquinone oxidoreductase subunit I